MEAILIRTLRFLTEESYQMRNISRHLNHMDTTERLRLLRQLLCIRSAEYALPQDICEDIDRILVFEREHRALTSADSIPTFALATTAPSTTTSSSPRSPVQIKLWRGDITTLENITAITNAANSQMLGCFQPRHKCIDNVIHSWAGPRLRQQCYDIMEARGGDLSPGLAITTDAFCLPCDYVVHTLGPQLEQGAEPTQLECTQLTQCYTSILDQVDQLPEKSAGSAKSIALCCISTGLFAFPARTAATIAVDAVASWLATHPASSLSQILFVTYTQPDHDLYTSLLSHPRPEWSLQAPAPAPQPSSLRLPLTCASLQKAHDYLSSVDTIILSAGAGLSAATGLDYTSAALFRTHFPTFQQYGFTCLYDVFGFAAWPSEAVRWSYFATHLDLVRGWAPSPLYAQLVAWLRRAGGADVHVRTSNADGLFVANGWDARRLSTPQGSYAVLQCVGNCAPDSYWPAAPFLDAMRACMDRKAQRLTDARAVPRCGNCGGDMYICVRAADWFNERPFRAGEAEWRRVRGRVLGGGAGRTTILEVGVGMNTPGVLRWPNEELVREGKGRVRLVRLGLGAHAGVPWDLEDRGWATYVDGDVRDTLPMLLGSNEGKD